MHLRALRIDARHHVFDDVVLTRRVHPLKDQQQSVAVVRVEQVLLLLQMLEAHLSMAERFVFVLEGAREVRRMPLDGAFIVRPDAKAVDIHGASVWAVASALRATARQPQYSESAGWAGEAGTAGENQSGLESRGSRASSREP